MSEVWVQVRPRPGEEGMLSGASATERLVDRIDEFTDAIGEVARRIHRRLDANVVTAASARPIADPDRNWHLDEVSIVFSADLESEAGVIIARTKASAGFEVSLKWSQSPG